MRVNAELLSTTLQDDLFRAGWDGAMSAYPGQTKRQFAMMSLANSFLKKLEPTSTKKQDAAALALFLDCNTKCRDAEIPDLNQLTELEAIAVGEVKHFLYDFFYRADQTDDLSVLTWSKIRTRFGLGKGANIGALDCDFMSKVGASTMATTSPLLLEMYLEYVRQHPVWSEVEHVRHTLVGSEYVAGSRLCFRPKTLKISRTICTEPVLEMLFQQGIASLLSERLEEVCNISLSIQPEVNRRLALRGSLTGEFGTIDLSSASDTVSTKLCTYLLPKEVLSILQRCRCDCTVLPDGTVLDLHMLSSMGNAFTFPLQTTIFSSIVYGCYRALGIPFKRNHRGPAAEHSNFAVFGDDVIVVREAYGLVCNIMRRFGFTVNVDKSFNEGPFRESCGHDYYYGYNVRGVYIKRLFTDGDVYSAINRLNRWSCFHRIPLCLTVGLLKKKVRFLPIPIHEMDDGGIKVPEWVITKRVRNQYGGLRYRVRVNIPVSIDCLLGVVATERYRSSEVLSKNPAAVVLAALAGSLRLGVVNPRENTPSHTEIHCRFTPCWEWNGSRSGLLEWQRDRDWKFSIALNLGSTEL